MGNKSEKRWAPTDKRDAHQKGIEAGTNREKRTKSEKRWAPTEKRDEHQKGKEAGTNREKRCSPKGK